MKTNAILMVIVQSAWSELTSIIGQWRTAGMTVAFTNGVFDLMHVGHLASIESAASFADKLIVGVNSDISAKQLGKGDGRPVNDEVDRATLLAGLQAVDVVVLFDEDTPYELLKLVRPEVLVKGGDYKLEDVVGREFAGRVELIPLVAGRSTTSLIDRLKKLPD